MTPRILCIGAAHWDYIGRTATVMDEGSDVPGEVIRRPGGVALNVALALAAAGARVSLAACLGDDADGVALESLARQRGLDVSPSVVTPGASDRYLALEHRDGRLWGALADDRLARHMASSIPGKIVESDHDLVFLDAQFPARDLKTLLAHLTTSDIRLNPVSPAKAVALIPLLRAGQTVYCNLQEAAVMLQEPQLTAREAATRLRETFGCDAFVTDGPREAAHRGDELTVALPAPTDTGSVTGAGDAAIAAHIMAQSTGVSDKEALESALHAAHLKMQESAQWFR